MRPARRTHWWPTPTEWSALHLEPDYRAEHERGIAGIAQAFGLLPVRADIPAFERHVIRKVPAGLTWSALPEGDCAILRFDASGSRTRPMDKLRALEGIAGAWGRDGFEIVAIDPASRRNVAELWSAFKALDVAILLGGSTGNPFERPGLTIAIASRVPEAIRRLKDVRSRETTSAEEVEDALASLLAPHVRPDAIPDVMRRSVPALGGRSLLEAAEAGDLDDVREFVKDLFDLGRVQP